MSGAPRNRAFFLQNSMVFSQQAIRFKRYLENVGVLSSEGNKAHGKQNVQRNKLDDLLDWPLIKDRDIYEFNISLNKEVITISKVKNMPDKEILRMSVSDYYMMVDALVRIEEEKSDNGHRTDDE